VLNAADARTEPQAQHGERGKVELGVSRGCRCNAPRYRARFRYTAAVEDEGRVAVALDGQAVERGVIVGDEDVKLQGEVTEARAVGLLVAGQPDFRQRDCPADHDYG
jgi:hypothetical protein